jgi:hypothetical protein
MVGWLIGAMRALFGDATWAIRVPAVALPLVQGGLVWWALRPLSEAGARWAVLLFWLAPINWLNCLITTDTPLMFWSILSAAFLMRAEQRLRLDRTTWLFYAVSGLALGCAFLSKYFSVVLALTYVIYIAAFRRERWMPFLLLVVCALPGPAINIAYNMTHGWPNIMFNLFNRNQGSVFSFKNPLMYAGLLFYLLTPVVIWQLWGERKPVTRVFLEHRFVACLVVVPLIFFAILSMKKVVGLHWVLSFYPFVFVALALSLPQEKLKAVGVGLAVFCAMHVLPVLGLYGTHLGQWKTFSLYPEIVQSYRTSELVSKMQAPGVVLMANSYSPASIYGYELRKYVPVFGVGDFHARQDDLLVDFSLFNGKTIRIGSIEPPVLADYEPYFQTAKLLNVLQDDAPFYVVEGVGFDYAKYRAGVLKTTYKKFYNIPLWLPMTDCPFCQRLCGQVRCQ